MPKKRSIAKLGLSLDDVRRVADGLAGVANAFVADSFVRAVLIAGAVLSWFLAVESWRSFLSFWASSALVHLHWVGDD